MSVFTNAEESQANAAELDRLRGEHAELIALWERLGMELEEQRD
jgi:ATP-binding cassette subfamily F protein 3